MPSAPRPRSRITRHTKSPLRGSECLSGYEPAPKLSPEEEAQFRAEVADAIQKQVRCERAEYDARIAAPRAWGPVAHWLARVTSNPDTASTLKIEIALDVPLPTCGLTVKVIPSGNGATLTIALRR